MRGVHEAGEAGGPAVRAVRARQEDAVVAPPVAAGELGDRHDLDRGDTELGERAEARDDAVEGAFGAERADVQLVDDEVAQRGRRRQLGDGERARVDDARRAAQAVRLVAAARVGQRGPVEHEPVVVARRRLDDPLAHAEARVAELVVASADAHGDAARARRPDAELDGPVGAGGRAQGVAPRKH